MPHYSGQQHHTTTGGVYINPRYNTKAVADLVVGRQHHHRHGGGGAVAAEPQEMIVIDYADGGGGGGGDPVQHRLNPHHHQQPHHHHQHYGRLGSSGSNSGIRDPIQVRVKKKATTGNMGSPISYLRVQKGQCCGACPFSVGPELRLGIRLQV